MTPDLAALKAKFTLKPQKKPLELPKQFVSCGFSPNGVFFFAGGMEGELVRWTVVPDKPEPELAELPHFSGLNAWVSSCVCLPDGVHVVAGDSWGQLACWKFPSETPEPAWKLADAHDGWLRDIAVSADGKTLVTCGRDGCVVLWSNDGKKQHEISVGGDLYKVRFAPDGKSLFVGAFEGKVTQWDVSTATKIREYDASLLFKLNRLQDVGGVRAMALSPDGSLLLVGGTQPANGGNVQGKPTVLVFHVADGTLKKKAEFGADGDVYVTDLEWHPDGCWLITTSGNPGQGKCVCWRVEDEQPLFETKLSNCHAVRRHPTAGWLAVLTTNANSNGNGKVVDKDGEYLGNRSPVQVFTLPSPA